MRMLPWLGVESQAPGRRMFRNGFKTGWVLGNTILLRLDMVIVEVITAQVDTELFWYTRSRPLQSVNSILRTQDGLQSKRNHIVDFHSLQHL